MTKSRNKVDERGAVGDSEPAGQDELALARERLMEEIRGACEGWQRAYYVERRALGLALFDTGWRIAGLVTLALTGSVVTVVAALLAVASLRRGLADWTQDAWWTDLAVAAGLFALLASAAFAVRRIVHRSTLSATRRRLTTEAG